jgi:hypothetical protein
MKALLKAIVRPFWNLLRPLRRRIATRFDQHLTHLVTVALQEHVLGSTLPRFDLMAENLRQVETTVKIGRSVSENMAADTNILLDSVVRELARLQMQVEALHDALDELRGNEGLALVVGEQVERMKAG